MGQEIVYCSKCQKRILGADYAKGLAYQLDHSSCCSACAVTVLETLPPKQKEQLLAKMVKATLHHESQSSGAPKSSSSASSTRKIPVQAPDLRLRAGGADRPGSSTGLIIGGSLAAIATVIAVIALSSGGSSPPPPAAPSKAPVIVKPLEAPVNPEEARKAAAAKEAMRKAREFAVINPKDAEGQIKAWKLALLETGGTGYEAETKREIERAEARSKEAAAQEEAALGRDHQGLVSRREFKKATELLDQAKSRHDTPEWAGSVETLRRTQQDAAARAFAELKEKAVAGRDRGDKAVVEEAKTAVAGWGYPEFVADLQAALVPSWTPIFDGKTSDCLSTYCRTYWKVVDGALIQIAGQADKQSGQSREAFGDGELRFRLALQGVGQFYVAVRQAEGGAVRVNYDGQAITSLGDGTHELIITCRGDQITATMDGNPAPVATLGKLHPRGRIQFNFSGGTFKIVALDYRPLN